MQETLIELNVPAVITDRHLQTCQQGEVMHYDAQVVSVSDYYPFGMVMKERSYQVASYAFGFNGQMKDNEISGAGNSYTAEYWQYDSRLGRRWNVDPKQRTWESPYAVLGNNPIINIDPKGDEWGKGKEKAKEYQQSIRGKISSLENESCKMNYSLDRLISKGRGDSRKANDLRNQISLNDENAYKLSQIDNELNDLGSSSTVYNLISPEKDNEMNSREADIQGVFEYNSQTKEMDIKLKNNDLGLLGHELKHAYQFEKGKLSFISGGDPGRLYDIWDEVEAYERQMFLGYQGIGDFNFLSTWKEITGTSNVTPTSVKSWNQIYKDLSDVQLTTSSLRGEFEPETQGTPKGQQTYIKWQQNQMKGGPGEEIYK